MFRRQIYVPWLLRKSLRRSGNLLIISSSICLYINLSILWTYAKLGRLQHISIYLEIHHLERKMSVNGVSKKHCTKNSFPSRISLVIVTRSVRNCGFGHIYWKMANAKLHFLCSENTNLCLYYISVYLLLYLHTLRFRTIYINYFLTYFYVVDFF